MSRRLRLRFAIGIFSLWHIAGVGAAELGSNVPAQSAATTKSAIDFQFADSPVVELGGITPGRLSKLLSGLSTDTTSRRGATEVHLYAVDSPGVVLIATNDALGSGSVIRSDGLVLTNLHVVGKNSTVAVFFKPRREGDQISKNDGHLGTVIRRDEIADLALVQVSDLPTPLKVIALANMTDVSIGSDVHAIGHPTGEAWSYTKGIVSQIRRDYQWAAEDGVKHKASVIQTQTPINPGNSGGPLLTDAGGLIGVNSFKEGGEGLNFAVSVEDVRFLLNEKSDRLVHKVRAQARDSACKPKDYGTSRLKDGTGTQVLMDIDCSGKPDAMVILPDSPSEPARLEVDTNHNGKIDGVIYSQSRDDNWDYSIWDTTGSGKADLKCSYDHGSHKPTRCEKIEG